MAIPTKGTRRIVVEGVTGQRPTMRLLRPRFTIPTLMLVVAISALAMRWFHPISRSDAEKIAEAKFLKLPTASRWIGRYRVQAFSSPTIEPDLAGRFTDGWTVIVSDPRDGVPFGEYFLSPTGRFITSTFAPGKFYGPISTRAPAK